MNSMYSALCHPFIYIYEYTHILLRRHGLSWYDMTKRRVKNDDDDNTTFGGMFVIFFFIINCNWCAHIISKGRFNTYTTYIYNKSALLIIIIMKGDPTNKFTISKWINLLVTIVNFYDIFLFVNVTHIQILMWYTSFCIYILSRMYTQK